MLSIFFIFMLPLLYFIEKYCKDKNMNTPIFPIISELMLFYVSWKVLNSTLNLYIKLAFITASLLHFIRLVLYIEKYKSIPILYQALGIIGNLSLYTNYYFVDALIKLFVNYKINKNFGLNMFIDAPATIILIIFTTTIKSNNKLINNYLRMDLIYHILEIGLSLSKLFKK